MARTKREPDLPPWRCPEHPISIRSPDAASRATPSTSSSSSSSTSRSKSGTTRWPRRRTRRTGGRAAPPRPHEDAAAPPPWLPPATLALLVLALAIANVALERVAAPPDAVGVVGGGARREENVWRRRLREGRQRTAAAEAGDARDYDAGRTRTRSVAVATERSETWPAYEGKHRFEECVDKSVAQCQTLIDAYTAGHPELFNNQTTLYLDVRKVREYTDESYYKVVLRTDMEGEFVSGIFGNGRVYYPWPWTVYGEDLSVGPWDCAGKSPMECCQDVQADVQDPNDAGDFMACFVEEPVGTRRNPERDDRAIAVVDADLMVVRAPIAH